MAIEEQNSLGRDVVSTANYKAREFGIHSARPITKAWELTEAAKKKGRSGTVFVPPGKPEPQKIPPGRYAPGGT